MVPQHGIKPRTFALLKRCSIAELLGQVNGGCVDVSVGVSAACVQHALHSQLNTLKWYTVWVLTPYLYLERIAISPEIQRCILWWVSEVPPLSRLKTSFTDSLLNYQLYRPIFLVVVAGSDPATSELSAQRSPD